MAGQRIKVKGHSRRGIEGSAARSEALCAARGAAHAGEEARPPRGGTAAVGAGGSTKFSGEFSSGKAQCYRERFRTGTSSWWHRGFPDENDGRGEASVREAEARSRTRRRSLIGQGPMPQGGRACGPLGGATRRAGCCARGGGSGASAGGRCAPLEGGTRKFREVLIGQGPMPRGEIQDGSKFVVASGFPR